MADPLRILLVEDSEDDARLLVSELRRGGYDPQWERVDTAPGLQAALARHEWHIITCDWIMPGFGAAEALRILRAHDADAPIIIVSGEVGEEVAVSAMKAGAMDFVSKHRLTRLVPAVERELRDAETRRARRRAEQALADSERYFRALFENAWDLIAVMDEKGTIRYASPSHERALGYPPEELVGHCAFDFLHPDDLLRVVQTYRGAIASRNQNSLAEFRFRHRDGSWHGFEGVAKIALDDPQVRGVIVTTREIDDRTRAEHELQRRLAFERLVSTLSTTFIRMPLEDMREIDAALSSIGAFAASQSAYIAVFSPDGSTWSVTHEWTAEGLPPLRAAFQSLPTELLSWSVERLRRLEVVHIPDVGALPAAASNEQRVLLAGGVAAVLTVPVASAGELQGFLGFGATHPRRWSEDEIALVKLVGQMFGNAMERRRTEEALRQSEQRFRSLSNSAPIGIYESDAQGRYLYTNPRWQEITGLPLEYSTGDGWLAALHPDDRAAFQAHWLECVRTGTAFSRGARLVTPHNTVRWAHTRAAPIYTDSGEVSGFVGTIEDVTGDCAGQQGGGILLVDDDGAVREVLQRVLEHAGYHVHSTDAAAALSAAAHLGGGVHLLIADTMLRREGGQTLAERLLERYPAMRVLYLSGHARDALDRVWPPGTRILVKPFNLDDLLNIVRSLMTQ